MSLHEPDALYPPDEPDDLDPMTLTLGELQLIAEHHGTESLKARLMSDGTWWAVGVKSNGTTTNVFGRFSLAEGLYAAARGQRA